MSDDLTDRQLALANSAVERWRKHAQEQALLGRGGDHHRSFVLRRALQAWRAFRVQRKQRWKEGIILNSNVQHVRIKRFWRRWKAWAGMSLSWKARVLRAAIAHSHRLQRHVWRSWRVALSETISARLLLERGTQHWRKTALRTALHALFHRAIRARRLRKGLRQAQAFENERVCARTWEQWKMSMISSRVYVEKNRIATE
jgi:hypothetical protein